MTKSVKDNGMSVGIITYDYFHLKTEQVVHKLLRKREIAEIKLFALPFKKREKRVVLIPHRPDQTNAITTEDLANKNGFEFIRWDGVSKLEECNYYIITGAGILPTNVIKDKKIGSFTLRQQVLTDFPPKELRSVIDQGKKDIKQGIVVSISTFEGKVGVAVGITKELIKKYDAVMLVKIASEILGGKGGGGRKDFAQAGGSNKDKIEDAFRALSKKIS